MTSSLSILPGSAPKRTNAPTPHQNSHSASNKNACEGKHFESQLDKAIPDSEETDKQDVVKKSVLEKSEENSETSESTSGVTPFDPITALLPTQMTIIAVESNCTAPVCTPTTESTADNGVIFSETENKSESIDPSDLLAKQISLTASPQTKSLTPSTSLLEQSNTDTSLQSSIMTPAPSENSTTNPTPDSLAASVAETPQPITPSTEPSTSIPQAPAMESLKPATIQAKTESITLSPHHRLETVLDSVFEEKPLPTPRRIEVKLQTPQGAQVTLYIARVNQELRAQFSANSSQAFTWLQTEIHQLRSVTLNQAIRWLPAQIESTPIKLGGSSKSSEERLSQDKDRDDGAPLESLFGLFKPSNRRLA